MCVLAWAWCWPLAAAAQALADGQAGTPANLAALDVALAERLRAGGVPGAAVVVIEDGQVVMARAYGVADLASGRTVTPQTVFRAGSISKTLTAVAVMQLVEQQRLDLNAPVAGLLPEWPLRGAGDPAHPLRLAHLLEHTSGLDDIRYRHYLVEGRDVSLSQALTLFEPYRLRWAPGSGTAYSNAGPIAVGRVIEKASGEPFDATLARAVTGPLGMASARWTRDPAQAGVLATSYQADGRTPEPYAETPARPSGSLSATALDLARLPLMFIGRGTLDGQRVLQAASVDRMEQPATSAAAQRGAAIGWGLALRADADGRTVFFGHDGSIDGFVATFAYAPALRSGYVVMANLASDSATDAAQIVRRFLERRLELPAAPPVQPVSAEQRQRWTGQYQSFTPRQELLRAVIGLTQWEGASFEGDMLQFERARWHHVGRGLFQKEGAAAPALLFIDTAQGVQTHTHNGAKRRVGSAEMAAKLTSTALVPVALLAGLGGLLVWAVAAARKRTRPLGESTWRLWPLAALVLVVAAPFSALALLATGDLELLGRPTPWAWGVWVLSWAAPLVAVAAAVALWRQRASPVGWPLRTLAWLQLGLAAVALAWLAAHGWIGMRIWDA